MWFQKVASMSNKALSEKTSSEESYWLLFWTFLKIGSTAFGGFMALISVVQNYVVERKKLLTQDEVLDGISLATILPGPVAVNVVAYVGYKIRGLKGALICAFAVIFPSFLLLLALSYAYFTYGEIPAVSKVFSGFLPAVAAIIIAAAFNMGRKALTGSTEILIAIASMLALIFIDNFYTTFVVMLVSGGIGYLAFFRKEDEPAEKTSVKNLLPKNLLILSSVSAIVVAAAVLKANALLLAKLFSTFATMSLLLFGGGFVFIPLIQEVVVGNYGWVTHKEFIDGIALGQVTPGPILISATFIGYKVAGVIGAAIATVGIFAPPAILMLVCTNFLDLLKNSNQIKAVLKGVRCAVIGLIAAAAYIVILSAEQNYVTLMIFLLSLIGLLIIKLEVAWIIPVAGVIGYLMY